MQEMDVGMWDAIHPRNISLVTFLVPVRPIHVHHHDDATVDALRTLLPHGELWVSAGKMTVLTRVEA